MQIFCHSMDCCPYVADQKCKTTFLQTICPHWNARKIICLTMYNLLTFNFILKKICSFGFIQIKYILAVWKMKICKGQLNSEWLYEVIVSPKMPTKNYQDFCPGSLLEGRAEILQIFGWHFGRNDDLIKSFWI